MGIVFTLNIDQKAHAILRQIIAEKIVFTVKYFSKEHVKDVILSRSQCSLKGNYSNSFLYQFLDSMEDQAQIKSTSHSCMTGGTNMHFNSSPLYIMEFCFGGPQS